MPQIAVTLDLDGLDAERVEEACFEFGALAVSYTDQHDDPILEPAPGEFRLWPHSRLQALFSFDCKPQEIVAGLAHVLRVDESRLRVETLADRVWEREWLRDFHPMCFGQRLWVAPHHSHVHTQGAVIVRLDPGLAFGTGTHATTAMCLSWLDEQVREGQVAIDYGCGSGVLAVKIATAGPVITAPAMFGVAGQPLSGTISVSSPGATSLSVTIAGAPLGMGFSVAGTTITAIERCSGHDGTYAVKREYREASMRIAKPVVERVKSLEADHFASDCPMAAAQIASGIPGLVPRHPLGLLRKAYGL